MSGRHASTSRTGSQAAPPVADVGTRRLPPAFVPNRERTAYLTSLAGAVARVRGFVTAFSVRDGKPVVNVIVLDAAGRNRAAVTVGCEYVRRRGAGDARGGAWWFVDVRDGRRVAPATEVAAAAELIRAGLPGEAA
ncbi:hypothetical protein [Actinomadura parmotrematis]|uniref:hypothetical protein n=1 Tax=Actinomadura parmotrematis TaxID=2864039 RepID=UPI00215D7E8C|nr:hypothetical protein [Actinomadura parmotrematis]